jgi:hypothetical protein
MGAINREFMSPFVGSTGKVNLIKSEVTSALIYWNGRSG